MGFTDSFNTTFAFVFWISVLLMVAITFAMIYFMIRYHHSRNKQASDIHGHLGLEVTWTVIPTILVMIMFYYGYIGYKKIDTVPAGAMVVETTGRMWSWSYKYENGAQSDVLVVPQNQPVQLNLHSVDVLHSYYIPAFKVKRDVVPGVNTHMWFEAAETGEYDVFCAEYCGDRHSYMLSKVKVLPQSEFDAWYANQEGMASISLDSASESDLATAGSRIYALKGCNACHTTDGSKLLGPSFKGIYGKKEVVLTAGGEKQITVDDDYIRRSILEPDVEKVKGYEAIPMPPQQLTDEEIAAITAFIKSLE